MNTERSWMYQKFLPNGTLNTEWCKGVLQFIDTAFNNSSIISGVDGKEYISCPCANCINVYSRDRETVTTHLLHNGFCNNYETWHEHGEVHPREAARLAAQSSLDNANRGMQEMLMNAAGPDFPWEDRDAEETPHSKAGAFFQMLAESEEPLWEIEVNGETITCENHSVLSAITCLLDLKAAHQLSQKCFNGMLDIVRSMLPTTNKLPETFYETKKRVKGLIMDYKRIDVCPNLCMLYYKDRENKEFCDECKEPRYKPASCSNRAKRVPRQVLCYLPISDRLQRMYMTRSITKHMRWHKEGLREKTGLMVHPADGEAWKSFDNIHPEFEQEVRNVRLGLSTYGFMPYSSSAAPYSCWPVFLFPYNLPPDLLMKEETMFLSLLIPGPRHPGRDIDVCLEPLVDELQELWSIGKLTYDVSRKENFNMKACLLWTVSDFPAYAMLSGWGTHGRLGCPYCMSKTKSFRLLNGGKPTWFGCQRCFLPADHAFRFDRKNFLKNTIDTDPPPPRLTGEELLNEVNQLPPIRWGKYAPLDQIEGYGDAHDWQKRSIFWNLPYWKTLLIRHNLDIMHLEKNFIEALLYLLLNIASKTKDNAKARQDLALYCNRLKLNLTIHNSRKPKAPYALTLADRREVLRWLKEEVKFPDGYAANLSRCINLVNGTIIGLKSHDFHIFMERLLPAAFRDYIPEAVWEPLCEISGFFREICAKELDPFRLQQLEKDAVVTICKLEKQFPPGFFDSMQHLVIHVAYEARVGGPVNCRWMYSSERRNKEQRKRVTNKARVEGSIIEAILIKEIANYCSKYFAEVSKDSKSEMRDEEQDNIDTTRAVIFEGFGRPLGRGKSRTLDEEEYKAAHNYVLLNCPEIQPLLDEFDEYIKNLGRAPTPTFLDTIRQNKFASWLRKRVLIDRDFDPNIRKIALMPQRQAICYEGYEVNGFRFQTQDYGRYRTRDNSGVLVKGECTDNTQQDYYGILQEIVEMEYEGTSNKVVLFKCRWFDVPNGVRVDHHHGLIEVEHTSTLRTGEPFIFACQATQVYYLPYASKKRERQQWWIVVKTKRKCNLSVEDVNSDFYQEERPNCPISVTLGQNFDWENVTIHENDFEMVDPADLSNHTASPTNEYDNESDNDGLGVEHQNLVEGEQEQELSEELEENDWTF